ncbi:MAG TPA: N-acetyl-gamma-glutamyl-phosphate reductase [Candidatus Norongarragalinales archaeon]|nr:N-acetyl-gamma-glutamyl-phosphate reductase [Candidatus Norongarragalinales archaeon]
MKKVGIIGASGYTGHELCKLLSKHKKVDLCVVNSQSFPGKKIRHVYPDEKTDLQYTGLTMDEVNRKDLDVVFLAQPPGHARVWVDALDESTKIVDLSADYRFADEETFRNVYGFDRGPKVATYGLPELFREKIKKAHLVANPGCYATACILAGLPIQKKARYAVFDCKSGWSGAGRESAYAKNPGMLKENLIAYKIARHRHKYEVEQFLDTPISFTPHVLPFFRGLMCTAHIFMKETVDAYSVYESFYRNEPFVSIGKDAPQIRETVQTNSCKIGGFETDENGTLAVVSVLDNLQKGASGQAVQNMNLMLGFSEREGLKT